MAENLVIVESPAKAKTIEKYLGVNYKVASSFGHISDLPSKNIGIDIENDFKPKYEISSDKKTIVKNLKDLVKKSKTVWLASDEDREGEAIAWHLFRTLKLDADNTKRIVFNEITKSAITNAINNPRSINYDLVDAQQARRVLDRIVGYELSPVLWRKVKGGLSAGRVQSVAVRLIVEKEREIRNYVSASTYKVEAIFKNSNGKEFVARLSNEFKSKGYNLISGGTDTHLVLIDLQNKNISGKAAEIALDEAGITVNKNMIPFDPKSPFVTSGIRIGSPAMTTRGMGVEEVKIVVDLIDQVILNHDNEEKIQLVKKQVNELCSSFLIYD